MGRRLSRRQALTAGAVAATAATASCGGPDTPVSRPVRTEQPARLPLSSRPAPGRDPGYVRDLTPGTTPVRFASFAHRLDFPTDGDIGGMVRAIREAGYTSATTTTPFGRRNPWLDATDTQLRELHDALRTHDVTAFDVMVWTNMIHPDPATREAALAYIAENIEAAERIGSPMVTAVTGGNDPEYYIGAHPDNWSVETWDLTVACVRRLLDETAGMKAALGIEAVVTTNIDGPDAHRRLMEDVGDPRCKVCLDPTNMLTLDRIYRTPELLDWCFDSLGEDILGCHAKDDIVERDRMLLHITQARAGTGLMDYETYIIRMSRMAWPRTLLIEHEGPYDDARDDLTRMADRLGVKVVGADG